MLVFALQIVPIQVTLIPLLTLFVDAGLNGTFWPIWIAHTIFGLPLAIFLMHNFMRELPSELVEAASVDGAGPLTIFFRIMLPLMVPAIAAFAIFQFLWVWNDLLVGLTFGASPEVAPLTVGVAAMAGSAARSGSCCPPARSSRWSCRCWCSSPSSGSSCGVCSQARSRGRHVGACANLPEDFTVGVGTSSWQVEGASASRGRTIWDDFAEVPGAIVDGSLADPATWSQAGSAALPSTMAPECRRSRPRWWALGPGRALDLPGRRAYADLEAGGQSGRDRSTS